MSCGRRGLYPGLMAAAKFYARFTVLRSNDCVTDEGEPEGDQQISEWIAVRRLKRGTVT